MFKNIIVPIDTERPETSKAVLDKAKELSDKEAKVTVAYVVEDLPGLITAELPEGLIQKAAHTARNNLVQIVEAAGLAADVQVRSGRPHNAIVDLADELGADLILMASHDPGLRDYFLSSTAASVVQHANCTVMIVR